MFFVGAACAVVAVRFFFVPGELERTSVGRALPGMWDEAWSALYLVGGALIMLGVGLRRPRLELPGITLTTSATIANGAAILLTNGSRAYAQIPLYVLALWVFDGRARDLKDLPRDRRHRGDPRAAATRVERRLMISAAPALIFAAGQPGDSQSTTTTILVAVIGGGLVTALSQLLMYRPQRRSLEGGLSKMAVEAAAESIKSIREENTDLKAELASAELRIDALEAERGQLRERVGALERQAQQDRQTIAALTERD
jgi:hypothetical protein